MQPDIRQKLHDFIDKIEDKKAEAIYTIFENEIETDSHRRNLIRIEREKYLMGAGTSYDWETVKDMVKNKEKRNGL
ncbi:MAG: hypothetical protein ABIW38_09660 [Ferruginibacter sp.]